MFYFVVDHHVTQTRKFGHLIACTFSISIPDLHVDKHIIFKAKLDKVMNQCVQFIDFNAILQSWWVKSYTFEIGIDVQISRFGLPVAASCWQFQFHMQTWFCYVICQFIDCVILWQHVKIFDVVIAPPLLTGFTVLLDFIPNSTMAEKGMYVFTKMC